jgi:hypothetical protein
MWFTRVENKPKKTAKNSHFSFPKSGVSAIPPLAQSLDLKDLQQFKRWPRRTPTFIMPQRIKRHCPRKQPIPGLWIGKREVPHCCQ